MVSKPERGRYLTLEDVRVSYKHKDDTIHLTSADPDIPNGSFYITLNRDTPTEEALRELLIERGYIKENDAVSKPEDTQLDSIYSYRPRNPLQDLLVDSLVGRGNVNFPRYVHISGQPGCGKTFLAAQTVEEASAMGINTYIISADVQAYLPKVQGTCTTINLPDLPEGSLNPFALGLNVDEILNFLINFILPLNIGNIDTPDGAYFYAQYRDLLRKSIGLVATYEEPSLDKIVENLESKVTFDSKVQLQTSLKRLKKTEFGHLLFGTSLYVKDMIVDKHIIIDTGALPYVSVSLLPDTYTVEQLAAVLIKKIIVNILNKKINNSSRPSLFIIEESIDLAEEMIPIIRSKNITLITINQEPITQSNLRLSSSANQMIGRSSDRSTQDAVDLPLDKLSTGEFFWYDINTGNTEFYKSAID